MTEAVAPSLPEPTARNLTDEERSRWAEITRGYADLSSDWTEAQRSLERAVASGRIGQPLSGPDKAYGLDRDNPRFAEAYWAIRWLIQGVHARLAWAILVCPPEKATASNYR